MRVVTAALLTVAAATTIAAQGLYSEQPGSLYEDWRPPRAHAVGDILTVLLTETTTASNTSTVETSKENAIDIASGTGTGKLSFIPGLGLISDASTEYTGEGSLSRQQSIQARVSVTVMGRKANGDLIVEGSREIEINGEREIIYLSGSVNPKIIPATNTIESYRIADLQVSYKGRGVLNDGTRPGFIVRVFNWIF
jgi:flagellar L-ring protein precursor FlgH